MNIIRIALIAPQEKDRQQLREQMFSYAVRWKVAVVTDCFDCLEEFAMAAQSGGYQLVCLRGGERQWRAAEELRRIRGEGETLWAYLEEGQDFEHRQGLPGGGPGGGPGKWETADAGGAGGPGAPGPPGGPPFPYAGANGLSQMTQTVFCAIIGQIPQREGDDFMKYEDIRRQVLTAIRQASAQGLIHGTSGNISVRDREAGVAAITPSGRPYDTMEPGDIAIVTLDGEWVDGPYAPSSETPMHTAVYRARPDVGAVVHNHALFCTVMAMAVDELPPSTPPQAEFAPIRVVPFAVPGSRALAASVAAALGTDGLAVLLRNHGSLCCGRDLPAAMTAAAYVEEAAQVAYYASALGRFTPLGEADIRACKEMLAAGRAV